MTQDRWFKVVGDRFDWVINPRLMRSWPKGSIGYGPKACIDVGLASNLIEIIRKPKNAKVDKDGQVYFDGD